MSTVVRCLLAVTIGLSLSTVSCKTGKKSAGSKKQPQGTAREAVLHLMDAFAANDCDAVKRLVGGDILTKVNKHGCQQTFQSARSSGLRLVRIVSSKPDGRDPNAHLVKAILQSRGKQTTHLMRVVNVKGTWRVVIF